MHELDMKKGSVPKIWCIQTVVLEKTLKSPLDSKEIKLVNPKGIQSWIFIGRTMLKLQYCGHLMPRANSLEKTLILGKIEVRRRKGWQRWVGWMASLINGHEFEQTPGDGEGQGSLACCSPWGHRVGHDRAPEEQVCELSCRDGNPHQVEEVNYMMTRP